MTDGKEWNGSLPDGGFLSLEKKPDEDDGRMREGRMARGGALVCSSRGSNVCIDVRMCVWTVCVVAPARGESARRQ